MSMTDPIAAYLTSIRNALRAKKATVTVPSSTIKADITRLLKDEGFIRNFEVEKNGHRQFINIQLKYTSGRSVIREINRISKPGCRVYTGKDEIPVYRNGVGVYILTTPKGIVTDRRARREKVGGEVICSIW